MNMPFVSVIIPNYNHACFLDERIQSILNQTYQNFEMIILDDCSTDVGASKRVIERYRNNDHVTHIVYNNVNSGSTFKQWHKGMELAKGELMWIAESDDSCDKNFLEILIRGYIENRAVLAFCRSCRYDINGDKSTYSHQAKMMQNLASPGKEFITKYMIKSNMVANASSAIFGREIALTLDKQYMSMRGEGDWLFWIMLMEHGNVYYCAEELNYFRFHDSNTTNSLTMRGVGQVEHKIIYDYIVSKGYLRSFKSILIERMRLLSAFLRIDYESMDAKRGVLRCWDKYRLVRLCIFAYNVKKRLIRQ